MHWPKGRVQFAASKTFMSAYSFQNAREKSFDLLLIIYIQVNFIFLHLIFTFRFRTVWVQLTCLQPISDLKVLDFILFFLVTGFSSRNATSRLLT